MSQVELLSQFATLAGSEKFDDVVLVPSMNPGGAEKYILQILTAMGSKRRMLFVSGEKASSHRWLNRLPGGSVFVDAFNFFATLSQAERDELVVSGISQAAKQGARLHLKASPFAHRVFRANRVALAAHFKPVYYRFCDSKTKVAGAWVTNQGIPKFLAEVMPSLDLVITDCQHIVENDVELFDEAVREKYHAIYAHVSCDVVKVPSGSPVRLLWASRLAVQKRPELLVPIMAELSAAIPEVTLDVYGSVEGEVSLDTVLDHPSISYRGEFDSWEQISHGDYSAFVYTSAFDGIPNILLEALATGLPVVAPALGGIPELQGDAATIYLVDNSVNDAEVVAAYALAIQSIVSDSSQRDARVRAGLALVKQQHSLRAHAQRVSSVFGLGRLGK